MVPFLQIAGGLVLLVGGADWLVRGAAAIAGRLGLSSLVIGLTVVAFGTSAPEVAVSVGAVWSGASDLAVANVVGSNTFNILVILGLAALVRPLLVERRLVRLDVPLMIAVSGLLWGVSADGGIGRVEAAALLGGCVVYTALQVISARRGGGEGDGVASDGEAEGSDKRGGRSVLWSLGFLVVGLAATVAGARLLVGGAVSLATGLGVSEVVIGLTIVAAGTSLPELATSVVAAMRGERDLAVGNVVGSCVFNVLAILGIAGLAGGGAPLPVGAGLLGLDIPVMVAASAACLPVVFTGHRVGRLEGGVFLAAYGAYLVFLVLDATGHWAAERYGWAVLLVGGPLVVVGLAVSVARSVRERGAR